MDFYTSENISLEGFYPGQPNGKRYENCAVVYVNKNGMYDNSCDSNTMKRNCICKTETVPILKLRGLCKNSDFDSLFTVKNDANNGQLTFYGATTSKLWYDEQILAWKGVNIDAPVTIINEAPKKSFLLGKHMWKFLNDSVMCNKGKPHTRELKMTGCKDDEFTCADGQCIKMNKRCDQVSNCRDESDEVACKILISGESYSNQVPPVFIDKEDMIIPALITVSISVLDIIKIAEDHNKIVIKFRIILTWKDGRLTFQNIKEELYLNTLKHNEIEELWTPLIVYKNTENNDATTTNDILTTVTVTREGNFIRSPATSVDEMELFRGSENTLTMNQSYTKEFRCSYNFQYFPFDTQASTHD